MELKDGDRVKSYQLLATCCDGTLCTTAQFTSLRVVCNITLQIALRDNTGAVKVPHSTQFNTAAVNEALGLGMANWDRFQQEMTSLSNRPVSPVETLNFFGELLNDPAGDDENIILSRPVQKLHVLYMGAGMGSDLPLPKILHAVWSMLSRNMSIIIVVHVVRIIDLIQLGLAKDLSSNTKARNRHSRYYNNFASLYKPA